MVFLCLVALLVHPLDTSDPADISAAIKWNRREVELQSTAPSTRPFKECAFDREGIKMCDGFHSQDAYQCLWKSNHSTGSVRILLAGNSISHRASKIIQPILKDNPNIKEIRLFAQSGCRPIEGNCPGFFAAMMKLVKKMKPAITFLIYDDSPRLRAKIADIASDKPLAEFVKFLKPFSENSKYLVVDEFYPIASTGVAASLHQRLAKKRPLDDLKKSYKSYETAHSFYFQRLGQLPAHFSNLLRHNTSGPFCAEDPGWCWWYNRKNLRAYFADNLHLTTEGLELLRDSYTKILEDLIPKVIA